MRSKIFPSLMLVLGLAGCSAGMRNSDTLPPVDTSAAQTAPASLADDPVSDASIDNTTTLPNLLRNPAFSQGNVGFITQYKYVSKINSETQYTIATDPSKVSIWGDWVKFGDHTTGKGNMLIVNGATRSKVIVWSETVHVKPHTNYTFGFWGSDVNAHSQSRPVLQASFNGTRSTRLAQFLTTPRWVHYTWTWNSGSSSVVDISVFDVNTAAAWNDFALDDMSLQ